ncbi:MAG: hypothetical protein H6679_03485 [Epsilonproteobacteria bacterium]|nr:hypothetical protein [Campylobacterota bacterium]
MMSKCSKLACLTLTVACLHSGSVFAKQAAPKTKTEQAVLSDKEFIHKSLENVLEPVSEFFEYFKDYAGILRPLMEESIVEKGGKKNSSLIGFFDSDLEPVAYFDKEITTVEKLKATCSDFMHFFHDLSTSLSDKAKKAYDELRAKATGKEVKKEQDNKGGKKEPGLKKPQMNTLNAVLEQYPIATMRMHFACSNASKVLKEIKARSS